MKRPKPNEHAGHNATHMHYAITCDEFVQLVLRSEGRCERCDIEMRKPVIDHDHAIGRWGVRGLICHRCNIIVATFEEGRRPHDDLTRAYLDAAPFFHALPEVQPGYRPVFVPPDQHGPRHDYRLRSFTARDVITSEEAREILCVAKEDFDMLILLGRIPGGRDRKAGRNYFRRSVVLKFKESRVTAE